MQYAVVIYLPPRLSATIEAQKRRYLLDGGPSIPPHVSVKLPFVLKGPQVGPTDVVTALRAVAAATRPIRLTLQGLGTFASLESDVIFIRVQPNRALAQLHARVVAALALLVRYALPEHERFEGPGFIPHVTLYRVRPEDRDAQLHRLEDFQPSYRFLARAMTLVQRATTAGDWRDVATLPLGGRLS